MRIRAENTLKCSMKTQNSLLTRFSAMMSFRFYHHKFVHGKARNDVGVSRDHTSEGEGLIAHLLTCDRLRSSFRHAFHYISFLASFLLLIHSSFGVVSWVELSRYRLTVATLINSRWHQIQQHMPCVITLVDNGGNVACFSLLHEFSLYAEDLSHVTLPVRVY